MDNEQKEENEVEVHCAVCYKKLEYQKGERPEDCKWVHAKTKEATSMQPTPHRAIPAPPHTNRLEIGDEILIKVKVVDFDSNPHGCAVAVEIPAFIDRETRGKLEEKASLPGKQKVKCWIHRLDQQEVIVAKTFPDK